MPQKAKAKTKFKTKTKKVLPPNCRRYKMRIQVSKRQQSFDRSVLALKYTYFFILCILSMLFKKVINYFSTLNFVNAYISHFKKCVYFFVLFTLTSHNIKCQTLRFANDIYVHLEIKRAFEYFCKIEDFCYSNVYL